MSKTSNFRVPLFIARRYFSIGKSFIKLLSSISMFGVAIGTAALVIVLSVFNGLEDLTRNMYMMHNPDIKISPSKGKHFEYTDALKNKLNTIEGVEVLTETVEDNALLIYKDQQKVINMKGVSSNFMSLYEFDTTLVLGDSYLLKDSVPYLLAGAELYKELSLRVKDNLNLLEIWFPKREKKVSLNPNTAFKKAYIQIGGIFLTEPEYDAQNVIVPMGFAKKLLQYDNELTSLEIRVAENYSIYEVQEQLKDALGDDFEVKNSDEQQAHILKAVKIEKFFTYIAFVFILGVASFNIFYSLAILGIEKKKDISILMTMGASQTFLKRVFLIEGSLIAFVGASVGLLLGYGICIGQQYFGWVSLGINSGLIDAYPVKIKALDFVMTAAAIIVITFLASIVPARNATKVIITENV
ncbi:FtsX-like permease family protein [Sediminitomix flava]|uniref:Lipoprotein-releasing system permease protein n=1 Tax=Sediminitomix flava TaxID=379075 RepID=A0A315YWM8_SEDFL|nr:FtsX-like permease family protein [Sediminitomix flava]PWJ34174.1 lipoprotein-releasing system permease protein [Sediminitomix flava]